MDGDLLHMLQEAIFIYTFGANSTVTKSFVDFTNVFVDFSKCTSNNHK